MELLYVSVITRMTKKYRNSKTDMRLNPANNPSKPPNDARKNEGINGYPLLYAMLLYITVFDLPNKLRQL